MKITEYRIFSEKITKLKIALISDLHDNSFAAVSDALSSEKPDLIALTGDITNNRMKNNSLAEEVFRTCSRTAPSFFCRGNHEWFFTEEDREICEKTGIVYLDNEYVHFGNEIYIGGLSTGFRGKESMKIGDRQEPDVRWLDDFAGQKGYKLLLSHHPKYYARYVRDLDIDLILSGHAHGGQIRIFNRGVFYPDGGFFPEYTKGVFDNRLVVSTGLSNTIRFIPRINNPTELVIIEVGNRQENC